MLKYLKKYLIKNLFYKRYINFKSIEMNALNTENSSDFDDLFTGKLDYLIVKNFITSYELTSFNSKLNSILKRTDLILEFKNDRAYIGIPILETFDKESYFTVAKICNEEQEQMIGFSFNNRIKEVIKIISDNNKVEIPRSKINDKSYLGSVVRLLTRNYNHHADKQTLDHHVMATEINQLISDENTLSIYTVLKNPEKGGRLYLFDILYKDTPKKILNYNFQKQFNKVKKYIEKKQVIKVEVNERDLIIFAGGQRWHMIEPLHKNNTRITMGCMSSYSKEKDKIYFWT